VLIPQNFQMKPAGSRLGRWLCHLHQKTSTYFKPTVNACQLSPLVSLFWFSKLILWTELNRCYGPLFCDLLLFCHRVEASASPTFPR
jgi:hypothetical protein